MTAKHSLMPVLLRHISTVSSIAASVLFGRPARFPIITGRMCSRMRSERSSIMYCSRRSMRKSSSAFGRRQFSLERQYRVSCLMFRLAACSVTLRTLVTPCLCPSIRGRFRYFAQRPLPSMIIATCCGKDLSLRSAFC